jgi:enterochelin esterase-like enzyme
MQGELRVVWDQLLPAFQKDALPENAEEQARLKQTLAGLSVSEARPVTNSRVLEDLSLPSAILKKDKKFTIYLPPDYETSKKNYPVLYLLHGKGDDSTAWARKGSLQAIMDACIVSGQTDPMIVVTPDAEVTFYMNQAQGNYQFEDFFFQELIPYIEKNYRCLTDKKHRAVAGLSMGGFGSLLYALHRPDLFQTCYAMSAAVRTDEEIRKMPFKDFLDRYKTVLGDMREGDERITDFWNKNSIFSLVKNLPEERKDAVRFFLDCGDDDFLTPGNSALHILMRETGIAHEYRVKNGAHTWDYWRAALPDALNFITRGMREGK